MADGRKRMREVERSMEERWTKATKDGGGINVQMMMTSVPLDGSTPHFGHEGALIRLQNRERQEREAAAALAEQERLFAEELRNLGTSEHPYSLQKLLKLSKNDDDMDTFNVIIDKLVQKKSPGSQIRRNAGDISGVLAKVLTKMIRAPKMTKMIIGAFQGVLKVDGYQPEVYSIVFSGWMNNVKVDIDLLLEKQKEVMDTYLDFIIWAHQVRTPKARQLLPVARDFFDKADKVVEHIRSIAIINSVKQQAYFDRLRIRVLTTFVKAVGRNHLRFPLELANKNRGGPEADQRAQKELKRQLYDFFTADANVPSYEDDCAALKGFGDDDEASAVDTVSVKCPVTATRMKCPARTLRCQHIQCFELEVFIDMGVRGDNEGFAHPWICPFCRARVSCADVVVSSYFKKLLTDVPPDLFEVEVLADLTWQKKGTARLMEPPSNRPNAPPKRIEPEREVVCLSDSD